MSDDVVQALFFVFQWENLALLMAAVLYGIIIGILPGIGSSVGMALAIPFALKWHPIMALIFMGALYKCAHYGGTITAILVNAPGEVDNAAAILDGYPMCEKGKGSVALAISATGAAVGGTIGMICLIFGSLFLAMFALRFGPAEYVIIALFALSIISAVVKGAVTKGLISAGLGLMISFVGFDSLTGHLRYTFGWEPFTEGINLIPGLIGLFAVTQTLVLAEGGVSISRIPSLAGGFWEGVITYFKYPYKIIWSAVIGLFIGVLPAVGQTAAGLIAWTAAKRGSKHPETFGKGDPEGLIVAETSSNACMPGDLVCTIALGVPGSVASAVFLGIMIIFGFVPGPTLFVEKAVGIYALFIALILTSFLMFLFGMLFARHLAKITLLPNEIIVPVILAISLLGSYALRNMMEDVVISLALGVLGYMMLKEGFTVIPLLLGWVLGEMVERNYRRALVISDGSYSIFYSSTICKILILLTFLSLVSPYLGPLWEKLSQGKKYQEE